MPVENSALIQILGSQDFEKLRENIVPTRPRADLILTKNESHRIAKVALRKI